jgi:putative hydrolase of the HAD superfamily
MYKVILFDLDETLYPRASTLMPVIGRRIEQYITTSVGIPRDQSEQLRKHWRSTYGTALRGLMVEGYPVDVDDYLHYVHDVPLEGVIEPRPELRAMLLDIPLRCVVLTNSNREHASRVLAHVNLADCFERVIDIRAMNFINKPDPQSYRMALQMLGVGAQDVILVEDTAINTRPARAMGMKTILVDCPASDDADFHVADVLEVGPLVRQLLLASED